MRAAAAIAGLAILLNACASSPARLATSHPIGEPVSIEAPLGLPPVPIPSDNPLTRETIALGKKLFFSTILSADGSISCATCHDPTKAFTDGKRISAGMGGKTGKRNAPTVINAAYNKLQFWDGRAASLEEQASGPMFSPEEMGHSMQGVEAKLSADPEIRTLFEAAFGPGPVTLDGVTKALASYQRTLLSGNSPFDRYFFGGDAAALGESARRGFEVFRDPKRGNCATCHVVEAKSALFMDHKFHNLGAGLDPDGAIPDAGRIAHTLRDGDQGAFRTPGLRNVALTAPYMHDGSLKTLKEVVDFYVGGGSSNQFLDPEIRPLRLTRQDREDLITFLESLTGEMP
jgi:cytochrome c peroxidase